MKEDRLLKEALEKILEKKIIDFQGFELELESDLKAFDLNGLSKWEVTDKELLAKLFIHLGETQLRSEDKKFLESFHSAEKIIPENFEIFYLQGRACLKYSHNLQVLSFAKKAFEKALALKPESFHVHYELGACLVQQGLHLEEANFFQKAITHFERAESLMEPDQKTSIFYWQYGRIWFYLGKLSGEAIDFSYAITKYKKVEPNELESPFYWNDYADALIELGFLIGKKEYFFEAIEFYKMAISLDPGYFQSHFNLACAYQCIFELLVEVDYFEKAHLSFEQAAAIESESKLRHAGLWLKWGQLLSSYGKLRRDISYLELSLEKFIQADAIESDHPGILSRFGEAEMLLGANLDDISLLKGAESKLLRSLELRGDAPEVWYLYGICLNELGRYFIDESYYRVAIQKFQYGLSLTQSDPLLWYGLAMSHFAIGEMTNNREMIEKASRYCSQVQEFGGDIFLQFWNDWAIMLMRLAEMTLDVTYVEAALEKFEHIINSHNDQQIVHFAKDEIEVEIVDLEEEKSEKETELEANATHDLKSDVLQDEENQKVVSDKIGQDDVNQTDQNEIDQNEIDLEWLYNYGCLLDMHGDFTDETASYEQSVQVLSNVLKIDPGYTHARYNLALALSHLGEATSDVACLEKALEHFKILATDNPEDEIAFNDWGLTLLNLGELVHDEYRPEYTREIYELAEKKFLHALSLGFLPAFYNLACLYAMMENYKAAIHYMERAELMDALPPLEDIMHDEWLYGLRKTDAFKTFISVLVAKYKK